ncbi:MAG: cysteine--tRNA ligase [Chloroflexi bacterium]|nr:cysteine--tRNA ligase [Chloroflexota bacterium]MBP8056062.1 cysteine--tRNA ligase [Chloroflexota bacterium]
MSLKLYNTMTRSVDLFTPITADEVGLYTCGFTVYNFAHIGNLRTYIFEDLLRRTLTFFGYRVKHVMNVTDVGHLVSDADEGEDKMAVGMRRTGKSAWEMAAIYWQAFKNDMERLNLLEPDIWCKATDHIPEQISLIETLEAKGYTYTIDDGVYFDTTKLDDYGKLARLDVAGLQAGSRIEMGGKRQLTDFALWKFSPRQQKRDMEWDSPWGVGFPGWHIECSAMAVKYLGEHFDIHCGGIDHIPVHHTNEIAQTESATGRKPWVNWWMHGEFLVLSEEGETEGVKMSKSKDNFLTLEYLIEKGYDPLAYRYFCLNGHYRSPLTFSWGGLDAAANAFARLKHHILELQSHAQPQAPLNQPHLNLFQAAIADDLNMPRALAALWGLLRDTAVSPASKYATLLIMDTVLGFNMATLQPDAAPIPAEVMALVEKRAAARQARQWSYADELRQQLTALGYTVEDTPTGPKIKPIRPAL